MMGRESPPPQASLFYTGINLDNRVRSDHMLCNVARLVEFDIVYAEVNLTPNPYQPPFMKRASGSRAHVQMMSAALAATAQSIPGGGIGVGRGRGRGAGCGTRNSVKSSNHSNHQITEDPHPVHLGHTRRIRRRPYRRRTRRRRGRARSSRCSYRRRW